MLFLACNSFFCCSKIESRTSIRAFFFNPIATVFFCFHRRNCYEVSGTSLSKGSLTSFSFFFLDEGIQKEKEKDVNEPLVLHTAMLGCFWVCLSISVLVILVFFCPSHSSPYSSCFGMRWPSILMTWPVQRSWALISIDSMLCDSALSSTSRFEIFSCHRMFMIQQRDLMWNYSSCLMWRRRSGDGF